MPDSGESLPARAVFAPWTSTGERIPTLVAVMGTLRAVVSDNQEIGCSSVYDVQKA